MEETSMISFGRRWIRNSKNVVFFGRNCTYLGSVEEWTRNFVTGTFRLICDRFFHRFFTNDVYNYGDVQLTQRKQFAVSR